MREYLGNNTESSYETRADDLIQLLQGPSYKQLGIIALGGVSGAGKTNFAQRLGTKIDSSTVLHMDDYISPEAPVVYDTQDFIDLDVNQFTPKVEGLITNAWNLPQFVNDVSLFTQGAIKEATVDDPKIKEAVDERPFIGGGALVIEGAHVLNLIPLQDKIQSRVLLEASFHDRFMRKIVRSSRLNMRSSLDFSINRYINGSEVAWRYYKDEYERRADYIINNPADPINDYAHFRSVDSRDVMDYHLIPSETSGDIRSGEALQVGRNRKALGKYVLNYSVNGNIIVSSEITTKTLELLLGYYDMERADGE